MTVQKAAAQQDVRIAIVGVQAPILVPFESALRNVFENMVESTSSFQWGHRLENAYDTRHRDYEDEQANIIHFHLLPEYAVTVSILIEQVSAAIAAHREEVDNTPHSSFSGNFSGRQVLRNSTFKVAIYEVFGEKIGRVKVLGQCHFYDSAVGAGMVKRAELPTVNLKGVSSSDGFNVAWPRNESFGLVFKGELATPELRQQLEGQLKKKAK